MTEVSILFLHDRDLHYERVKAEMSNFVSILTGAEHKKHYTFIKKCVLIKLAYVDLIVKCSDYRKMEYFHMKI